MDLRWAWVFLERTRILSGIQFTMHFIEIFVEEPKRFVGSFENVILTRQTCGQRSSRAAESNCQALGNYFSERICYMFLISKCRGDRDLGLCTTSVLAFGDLQRNCTIQFFLRRNTCFFFGSRHFSSCLCSHLPKLSTNLDPCLLYILILRTSSKFARKNNFLALSDCFPQPSPPRALAADLPRQDHVYKTTDESFLFHNKNFDEMRCKLDSTENPRSFEKYPTPP